MQQQQQDLSAKWKRNFGIIFSLCVIHQRALTIPMRSRFGVQALAQPCFFALGLMFLWATFTRDPFMWLWMGYWFLHFLYRRAEALRLARSGEKIHSQYDGWPHDAVRFGRTEKAAKMVVEPIEVAILGGILYWIYAKEGWPVRGLPLFLLSGAFTLPFVEMVKQTIWERRTQSVVDARIEQEQLVEDVRQKLETH
jgi:hypothetical protein